MPQIILNQGLRRIEVSKIKMTFEHFDRTGASV